MPEMTEYFVFVGDNPEHEGGEGVVGAFTPGLGSLPLCTHHPPLLTRFEGIAQGIADATGKPIKLVRFARVGVVKTITPRPQG